jgi:hypothetical protein
MKGSDLFYCVDKGEKRRLFFFFIQTKSVTVEVDAQRVENNKQEVNNKVFLSYYEIILIQFFI